MIDTQELSDAPTEPGDPPVARDAESVSVGPAAATHGLARIRMFVLLAGYLTVAAAACGIFDQFEWSILLAPVLPAVAAIALVGRHVALRTLAAVAAVIAAVVVSVVANSGAAGDVVDALTSGAKGLLSTDWPSPDRADLIGTVVAVIAAATALSVELAGRRRFHLLPLVPMLVCYVAAVGLSSPRGVDWTSLVVLGVASTLFALIRNDGTLHDRWTLLRGERRILALLLIGAVVVALITLPVALGARADPRRDDPAQQTDPIIDPIEVTLALRALDPAIDLHRIVASDGTGLPQRWRTAALASYDGRRWSPALTLRPIGRTLGSATGPVVDASIEFLDDTLTLVPLPGAPISVDADVDTDAERTVVRLSESPGNAVSIVANVAPSLEDAERVGVTPRIIDESTSTLTDLATALAGPGDMIDQLTQLETTMREEFVFDSGVQGGGLQQALIDRFLRDTQRGTSEQFAAAFVLLARAIGIEARVATGYVVTDATATAPETGGGELTLRSSDAAVWPEVRLDDGRWLAFDPVPAVESNDGAPPPPEPQIQTPAAPQPPIDPPPDPDNETPPADEPTTADTGATLSAVLTWTVRIVAGLGVLLAPLLVAAALIVGLKHRRRRRRLRATVAAERIRGAWALATDALVDAGLTIATSATDGESARDGEPLVAGARRDLLRLATMAGEATYGSPQHPDLLAEDATKCLDAVEVSMATERTRWRRMRWRLSLRSLRPSTRSPVAV